MPNYRRIGGRSAAEIAESIKEAIRDGQLVPGVALPPIRTLAAEIGVNRHTVAAAYGHLADAGMVSSRGRAGTLVAPIEKARPPREILPPGVHNLTDGNPDPAFLPDLTAALRATNPVGGLYCEPPILKDFYDIGRRWFSADGVDGGHLSVTSGALHALELILTTSLLPGDLIAVESPCFHRVLYLIRSLGLVPVPVPVDQEGICPESLQAALKRPIRALIVTPRAHNPTGVSITERRLSDLRRILAHAPDLLIIQDDYFSLLARRPSVWLAGPERRRWAVIRSFSKVFGPDLRVALTMGDRETVAELERRLGVGPRWISHILQGTAAYLLNDKATITQLRLAAQTYDARRHALICKLQAANIEACGEDGLNVWATVPYDQQVSQALLLRGWAVKPANLFYVRDAQSALRISIGGLGTSDIEAFVGDLSDCLSGAPQPWS